MAVRITRSPAVQGDAAVTKLLDDIQAEAEIHVRLDDSAFSEAFWTTRLDSRHRVVVRLHLIGVGGQETRHDFTPGDLQPPTTAFIDLLPTASK